MWVFEAVIVFKTGNNTVEFYLFNLVLLIWLFLNFENELICDPDC